MATCSKNVGPYTTAPRNSPFLIMFQGKVNKFEPFPNLLFYLSVYFALISCHLRIPLLPLYAVTLVLYLSLPPSRKKSSVSLTVFYLPKESTFILRVNRKRKKNHTRNLISRLSHYNLKTFLRVL